MKKTMSIVLAVAMCLSMAVTALADQIQPRSPSCDECGGHTYCISETTKHPSAPQRCDDCGTKTYDGTLTIWGYACSSCGAVSEVTEFICSDCQ